MLLFNVWIFISCCLLPRLVTSQILVPYRVTENVADAQVGVLTTENDVIDVMTSHDAVLFVFTFPDLDLPLTLDDVTGEMRTSRAIDREESCASQSTCYLNVDVSLLLLTREPVDSVRVRILIDDQNDNAPLFDADQFEMEISESAAVGSTRPLPVARDLDSPQFGVDASAYELEALSEDSRNMFVLDFRDDAPQLRLNRQLDREDVDAFDLQLVARDLGVPPLSSTLQLTVRVVDFNDHAPVFDTDTYSKVVREDFAIDQELLRVNAEDADIGVNADIRYAFDDVTQTQHGDVFAVDVTTGALTLIRALDFEQEEEYSLLVVARDSASSPLSATATVEVRVEDVNDNRPQVGETPTPKKTDITTSQFISERISPQLSNFISSKQL